MLCAKGRRANVTLFISVEWVIILTLLVSLIDRELTSSCMLYCGLLIVVQNATFSPELVRELAWCVWCSAARYGAGYQIGGGAESVLDSHSVVGFLVVFVHSVSIQGRDLGGWKPPRYRTVLTHVRSLGS